ncbi:response regulator [Undibacterium umbellatum]|uniref:Response regulator n=1 Tax=Undibacterium umbellatum TaxID=2762300 RepID=A0ABR6Z7W2_9BURK|nr:response regulator [Undibacterium umbellatum]MBC3907646.1 response regulator [Undibacterium umbellatum]
MIHQSASEGHGHASNDSILIVDDAPPNIGLLYAALQQAGYQIYAATSGAQALLIAHEVRPNLILLDVVMPGMDGFETCRRLKNEAATEQIPIIFITAANSTEDIAKGFSAGAVDYLSKPLRVDELLIRVKMHLQKQHFLLVQQEQTEKLKLIVDNMSEAVVLLDAKGQITFSNPACHAGLGYTGDEVLGKSITSLLSERQPASCLKFFSTDSDLNISSPTHCGPSEVCVQHSSGKALNMDLTLASVFLQERHYVGLLRDRQPELQHHASLLAADCDPLTNLANLRRFEVTLEQCWQYCLSIVMPVSLLQIRIHQREDCYHHAERHAGDQILQEIARILLVQANRRNGLAARIAEHEFALLVPDLSKEATAFLTHTLRDELMLLLKQKIPASRTEREKAGGISIAYASQVPHAGQTGKQLLDVLSNALPTRQCDEVSRIIATEM